ncbi:MAG TPA: hypothetical protein VED21_26040, partial [Azospirillum sp.]|nr:hypothetical protein [Azospirillum sp.]
TPPLVVLNRVGALKKAEVPLKDFVGTVGASPAVVIPEDAEAFGLAACHGRPLTEVKPKSKAAEGVERLAALLARRDAGAKAPAKAGGGLKSLLQRFHKRSEKV